MFHLNLHTTRSPTYSDIHQRSYWCKWLSWWWALSCSKHVENWNKQIQENELCVNLVIYKQCMLNFVGRVKFLTAAKQGNFLITLRRIRRNKRAQLIMYIMSVPTFSCKQRATDAACCIATQVGRLLPGSPTVSLVSNSKDSPEHCNACFRVSPELWHDLCTARNDRAYFTVPAPEQKTKAPQNEHNSQQCSLAVHPPLIFVTLSQITQNTARCPTDSSMSCCTKHCL